MKWIKLNLFYFVVLFFFTLPFTFFFLPHPGNDLKEFILLFENSLLIFFGLTFEANLEFDSLGLIFHLIVVLISSSIISTFYTKKIYNSIFIYFELIYSLILVYFLFRYGFDKIYKIQFFHPEGNIELSRLGSLDLDILYWSTMGKSYSYSLFLGISEVLAGLFIIFNRTKKLGLILSLFILINVLFVNISFQIEVKILCAYLLLINLILLSQYTREYAHFFFNLNSTYNQSETKSKLSSSFSIIITLVLTLESSYYSLKFCNLNADKFHKIKHHGIHHIQFDFSNNFLSKKLRIQQPITDLIVHKDSYLIFKDSTDKFYDFKIEGIKGNIFEIRINK